MFTVEPYTKVTGVNSYTKLTEKKTISGTDKISCPVTKITGQKSLEFPIVTVTMSFRI